MTEREDDLIVSVTFRVNKSGDNRTMMWETDRTLSDEDLYLLAAAMQSALDASKEAHDTLTKMSVH